MLQAQNKIMKVYMCFYIEFNLYFFDNFDNTALKYMSWITFHLTKEMHADSTVKIFMHSVRNKEMEIDISITCKICVRCYICETLCIMKRRKVEVRKRIEHWRLYLLTAQLIKNIHKIIFHSENWQIIFTPQGVKKKYQ